MKMGKSKEQFMRIRDMEQNYEHHANNALYD